MIQLSASPESWADGPMVAFDLETTGIDTATDRLVTAAVVCIVPGQQPETWTWLADPGVDIPTEAAEIHGITTEHARQHGRDAAQVVDEITETLAAAWSATTPLCAFQAPFDLSLLDAELRRHHGRDLEIAGPVVDPLCLDRQVDRYRKGKRTLTALCEHYRIRAGQAHTSAGDALTTARLAWRLAKSYPDSVGTLPLATLHQQQTTWCRTQNRNFADYLDRLATQRDPEEADSLRRRARTTRALAEHWPLRRDVLPTTNGSS